MVGNNSITRDGEAAHIMNQAAERLFRNYPIRYPLFLLLIGSGCTGWMIFGMHVDHVGSFYALGFSIIMAVAGAVLLPFGIAVAVRRRINVVVLRCPRCGAVSRQCPIPFKVERWGDVDYAYVVCSQCGGDFTVSKYARLA
jgi:hypothetical protein